MIYFQGNSGEGQAKVTSGVNGKWGYILYCTCLSQSCATQDGQIYRAIWCLHVIFRQGTQKRGS